ncbi:MAG: hypothetical protein JHC98_04100 [Thermoleophilaceae bacterium]|nr:hypothetical protein [Thermoleophilaceae bacterium]
MKFSRSKLLLLALVSALAVTAAPSTASALGPDLPKPTVTGIPAATNQNTVTFTVTTTVPSNWFVDFGCGYDSPILTPCDAVDYPTCTPAAGGQHTCSQTVARAVTVGKHAFRFVAAYCDDPTLIDCENNDNFYASNIETVSFFVDQTKPIVIVSSGPDRKQPVLTPGAGAFVFAANEAVNFTCAFDDDPFVPCSSPFPVPKYLKNGVHTFFLIGTDGAGNQGGPGREFRVDVFHPKKCKKGSSKRAKAKYKKCKAKNVADKKAWKKKHNLK